MSDPASKSFGPGQGASAVPAKIGRYEVVSRLGSGRTGTVYRATDPFIGRVLAIKTFRVDLPPGAERDRFLQRFYHEARISGGLSHPNIVALFDVGEVDGLPYLVFEHVEGPTLDVALARGGRLDSAETIRVVEHTAAALDFAHSRGIVHRDIRPANIILGTDKRVRIADFGIARVEGSHLTQLGEVLGTPAYMSPEQIRGEELSASSDFFSLAVCTYEMLSGQRPFVGKSQAELLEALVYAPPAEPKELRALGIPSRDFMFVFERALAKDPSHRFASGSAFARALKSCLGVAVSEEARPLPHIAIPESLPTLAKLAPAPVAASSDIDTAATGLIEGGSGPARSDSATPVDMAATGAIEGGSGGPGEGSSADATLVSSPSTASTEPGFTGVPADLSAEATLLSTVGFGQKLTAENASSADATMVSGGEEPELPPTQRLSRQAVESLLSKSAPSQPRSGAPSQASSASLPPTRELPRIPTVSPPTPLPGRAGSPVVTASDTATLATPPAHPSDDKTIMMTESEKAAAAKVRHDRSTPPNQAASKTAILPKPAPPPLPKAAPSKPATVSVPPLPLMGPPRPSLSPKILIAGASVLLVLGLAGALVFGTFRSKASGPTQDGAEKWNDLPVYREADVEKSPLVIAQDVPRPKIEKTVSVTVSWIVTPEGLVDDPKIVISASPEIDAFVVAGIRKWRYEPGQKDGKTVPVRVLRKYTYEPRGGS